MNRGFISLIFIIIMIVVAAAGTTAVIVLDNNEPPEVDVDPVSEDLPPVIDDDFSEEGLGNNEDLEVVPEALKDEESDDVDVEIQYSSKPPPPNFDGGSILEPIAEPIACTQDARVCPDGTVVGRTGSNCIFVCPEPDFNEDLPPSEQQPPPSVILPLPDGGGFWFFGN